MEKNVNLVELLKDCPKGMELDCTMFDNVTFARVDYSKKQFPIEIVVGGQHSKYLTKEGCYHDITLQPKAKCVIFPKGKTTWEGFVPPCQFKDGDVVAANMFPEGVWIGIFKQNEKTVFESHCSLSTIGGFQSKGLKNHSLIGLRLADEEEKEKLFDAIKAKGYRWNAETKTLEVLPKFKVGDKITNGKTSITIGYIDSEYYYEIGRDMPRRLSIKNQDEWELVPNKFDITNLKPFESKVLVRDINTDEWRGAFYSHYKSKKFYTIGSSYYYQCIPYEGNEHLLDTTDDCDEFYKTW